MLWNISGPNRSNKLEQKRCYQEFTIFWVEAITVVTSGIKSVHKQLTTRFILAVWLIYQTLCVGGITNERLLAF